MNKDLEHYILYKNNFLNDNFCTDIIINLEKKKWVKHEWYKAHTDKHYHESKEMEPETIEDFNGEIFSINNIIIKKLRDTLKEYINRLALEWFNSWTGYSSIKFIKYSVGQTMSNHYDGIESLFDGKRKGIPTLSIIGTLNDNYEGGEFVICEDKKIDMKTGDLIIFPSNFLYPHKVNPVKNGIRYSYVSWTW